MISSPTSRSQEKKREGSFILLLEIRIGMRGKEIDLECREVECSGIHELFSSLDNSSGGNEKKKKWT